MLTIDTLLDRTMPSIPEDLALDEALLLMVEERPNSSILRFWEPTEYAVVLGASGKIGIDVHRQTVELDGIRLYRRSSGGGTVLIGPGVLNVTVILPIDAAPGLDGVVVAQAYVLERLARAIRHLSIDIDVRGSGDLTLQGRKVAGSAQRRMRKHFFVHVSILNNFDLDLIPRYLAEPERRPDYRSSRSHADFVTKLNVVQARLKSVIEQEWTTLGTPRKTPEIPYLMIEELVRDRFGHRTWIEKY